MAGSQAPDPDRGRAHSRRGRGLEGRHLPDPARARGGRDRAAGGVLGPAGGARDRPPDRGHVRGQGGRRSRRGRRRRDAHPRARRAALARHGPGGRMSGPDHNEVVAPELVTAPAAVAPVGSWRATIERVLVRVAVDRPLLLIALLIAIALIMAVLEPDKFLTTANASVVLLDTAQTGILACGMMLLLIAGQFDLSIGGILAFSGIIAGLIVKGTDLPPIVAFLVACAFGAMLGAINGTLVTRFRINALIATLATLSIYRGALQLVSGAGVTNIGEGFTVFGQTPILGIYSPFWFMAVIVIIFAFLVGRTRYFRQAYYIGGNARAAKLSGINVDRTVFSFFVIMGLLSGLACALLASRLNTAVVLAGTGVELKVITAVVLGGASLSGGVGTIAGAFLGVLLMALLQNAMIVAGISPFWQQIVVGIVLLVSVGLDQLGRARGRA